MKVMGTVIQILTIVLFVTIMIFGIFALVVSNS